MSKPTVTKTVKYNDDDLTSHDFKYDPAVHTDKEMNRLLMIMFEGCASDLGVDDPGDDAFQDLAGDMLSDRRVPGEIIDRLLKAL